MAALQAPERLGPRSEVDGLKVLRKPSSGPQTLFLQSNARECLMGGAVLGGKSEALLMAPLRWVWNPHFQGLFLRREEPDLRELIDRGTELYEACCPGARWVESRMRFEFPSKATLKFGSVQRADDVQQYKTFEFSYIAFDELTTFEKSQYIYLLSRNRSSKVAGLPLHMRAGTNPDGIGHGWVYSYYVRGREPGKVYRHQFEIVDPRTGPRIVTLTRQFIPATVFDNPHVSDLDSYLAGLQAMGKDLADALLYGKWDFFHGQMFPYEFREVEPGLKSSEYYVVRCMDYGWSAPSVIYWLVVYPQLEGLPNVEVASELVVRETNVKGIAQLALYREKMLERDFGLARPMLSVIDPSAARAEGTSGGRNIQSMLQMHGLWFEKADNDRQSGWAGIRQLMENRLLTFWRGKVPYLLQTMPKLVRDPDKADDIKPKQDDHGADGLRYGVQAVHNVGVLRPQPGKALTAAQMVAAGKDPYYDEIVSRLERGDRESTLIEGW